MIGSVAERGHELGESVKANPMYLWVTTTDHKRIGLMYMYTAFIFFFLCGIEALIMRTQLAVPNNSVVSPSLYSEVFTMHGTIMIFTFMMPVFVGLANYAVCDKHLADAIEQLVARRSPSIQPPAPVTPAHADGHHPPESAS